MSPPEVWGPAVWSLFHTLAEKINVNAYPYVFPSLFNMIVKICKYLPCPECSSDASKFLAKVKTSELKTKESFKAILVVFHNVVNAKKRKPIFHYSNIGIYEKYKLIYVVNNFISQYQTKGNMKLLTESFQRQFVIKDFKNWFQKMIRAFVPAPNVPTPIPEVTEKPILEEPVAEELLAQMKEPLVEEPLVEEPVIQEPVIQEPLVEEPVIQEPVLEEPVIQEPLVEEPVLEEPLEETDDINKHLEKTEEDVKEEFISEPLEEPISENASVEENNSETNEKNEILDTNVETTQVSKKKNKKNKK